MAKVTIALAGLPGSPRTWARALRPTGERLAGLDRDLPEIQAHACALERRTDHVVISDAHAADGHEEIGAFEGLLDGPLCGVCFVAGDGGHPHVGAGLPRQGREGRAVGFGDRRRARRIPRGAELVAGA